MSQWQRATGEGQGAKGLGGEDRRHRAARNGPTARRAERTDGPVRSPSRGARGPGPGDAATRSSRRETKPLRPAPRRKTNPIRPPVPRAPAEPSGPPRDGPKGPRPLAPTPGPGFSERTERGTGGPAGSVPAPGPDSERTERRAGGSGRALPGDRGGADRTDGAASGAQNEPDLGPRRRQNEPNLRAQSPVGVRGRGPGVEDRRERAGASIEAKPLRPAPARNEPNGALGGPGKACRRPAAAPNEPNRPAPGARRAHRAADRLPGWARAVLG
jgi:hypothetical protein